MFQTLSSRPFLAVWLVVLAVFSYGFFVFHLILDSRAGGHSWKQGDWLINSTAGPIRRSVTGDLAIWIADTLSLDLIVIVVVAQTLIVALLYALVTRLIFAAGGRAVLILALSPAFFMTFWIADPLGSARKEMLAFVALAAYALGLCHGNRAFALFGCLCFLSAVAAHEAMILFAPIFWAALFLGPGVGTRFHVIALATTTLAASALCYAALTNGQANSFMEVCQPLLDRGVVDHMCQGSIRWLEYDLAYGIEFVTSQTSPESMVLLVLTYVICLAPFLYVGFLSKTRRLSLILSTAPFILVLPLFLTAVDHGRWISFHVFMSLVLFSVAVHQGRVHLSRAPAPLVLCGLFFISLTFAPTHIRDVVWGGVVRSVWQALP